MGLEPCQDNEWQELDSVSATANQIRKNLGTAYLNLASREEWESALGQLHICVKLIRSIPLDQM